MLIAGLGGAALLAAQQRLGRAEVAAVLAAGLLAAFVGPAAYALDTAATPHSGAIPSAGPTVAVGFGPGGGRGFGAQGGGRGGQFGTPFGGGIGGLLDAGTPSAELVTLLRQGGQDYTWVAAAVGSNSAAGIQLATGEPIMAIGGFNGTDPAPTLEQFQQYVSQGKIHYFIAGGRGGRGGGGGSGSASQIANWVEQNFTATSAGGTTLYDLTAPTTSTLTA